MNRRTGTIALGLILLSTCGAQEALNCMRLWQDDGECLAVAASGLEELLFIGSASALLAIDGTDPVNPERVGRLVLPGLVRALHSAGTTVFVANDSQGLRIVDVSSPNELTELGHIPTGGHANDVVVVDNVAYVAAGEAGLCLIDVSNPMDPSELGRVAVDDARAVDVQDGRVYLAAGERGLLVVDAADPSQPRILGELDTPGRAMEVTVRGGVAYVADRLSIRTVEVSQPDSLYEVGSLDLPGYEFHLLWMGPYLLAGGSSVVYMLESLTPGQLVIVSQVTGFRSLADFAFLETRLLVADPRMGLHQIDLADPAQPTLLSILPVSGESFCVAWRGDILAAGASTNGLRFFDAQFADSPQQVASSQTQSGSVNNVVLDSDRAFVSTGNKVVLLDLEDPTAPVEISQFPSFGLTVDMVAADSLAFVSIYSGSSGGGLDVLDLRDPTQLVRLDSLWLPGSPRDVALLDGFAYVAAEDGGLRVIDAHDPTSLMEVGHLETPGEVWGVAGAGNRLFLACAEGGLNVVDISDPAQPTITANLPIDSYATNVEIQGNQLFLAAYEAGLRVVDVQDPDHPVEVAWYDSPGLVYDVAVSGARVAIADRAGGMTLLMVEDDVVVPEPSSQPASLHLLSNYPNPFNPVTWIHFSMAKPGQVDIRVFDMQGRLVRQLLNDDLPAGKQSVRFDGTGLASGVYLTELRSGDSMIVGKMVLLK